MALRGDAVLSLSPGGDMCAGLFAGVVSRCLVAPLDVLKIRFQLQATLRGASPVYAGVASSAVRIVREEGVRALWRGNAAALTLWGVFAAVQFPVFSAAHGWAQRAGLGPDASTVVAGAGAGAAATVASYPFDWARTALAAQRARPSAPPSARALAAAARAGAARAGLGAALLAVVPATAIAFWARGAARRALRAAGVGDAAAAPLSGAAAGMLSKVVTFPLDTVKKRQQVGALPLAVGAAAPPRYAGVRDALRRIAAAEGGAALFRGLSPALLKAGVASALIFTLYDAAAAAALLSRHAWLTRAALTT
jgi:solute carrier family 25 thiamine pyrophosphate transporter 19